MSQNQSPTNWFMKIIITLVIILVGYNLYTGATVQEIGIPGIFVIKFREPTPTPTPTDTPTSTPTVTPTYVLTPQDKEADLVGYCQSKGYKDAILTTDDAYGWRCRTTDDRRADVDMLDVCRWQYGASFSEVILKNPNDPYSWFCRLF